jgi:hypothetical protein
MADGSLWDRVRRHAEDVDRALASPAGRILPAAVAQLLKDQVQLMGMMALKISEMEESIHEEG